MKKITSTIAFAVLASLSASAFAAGNEVTLYSRTKVTRIEPILKDFEKETGIKVNFVYEPDIDDRLIKEGASSPADVLLTSYIGRANKLSKRGLVQVVNSKALEANIPAAYRDDNKEWFGLTLRARTIFTSKDRVGALPADFDYLDLAKPELKGKVCMREGRHASNQALFASLIEHYGEEKTKAFLQGLKANLVQKPEGKDRQQVKLIKEGKCDYALVSSHYSGRMLKHADQKTWADAAVMNFPNGKHGVHMNVTAMALAKNAPNKENGIKLLEYLASDKGQVKYAELNYEFPVKAGLQLSKFVQGWGNFKQDPTDLNTILKHHKRALELVKEAKLDE